jgi:hypothetical protein
MGDNWMLRYHFKIKRRGPTLPSEFSSGFVGEAETGDATWCGETAFCG